MSVDPVTCHILDTTLGKPAREVTCSIYYLSPLVTDKGNEQAYDLDPTVQPFAIGKTDNDGRVKNWVVDPKCSSSLADSIGLTDGRWTHLKPGIYKIKFLTDRYFHGLSPSNRTFFPYVEITFLIDSPPDAHYHVPLLLSNHSYSTYRGS